LIKSKNLQYIVDLYYTTNFDDPLYDCDCSYACRCRRIISIDSVDVDIELLGKNLLRLTNPIDTYGFQRILVKNNAYDLDSYDVDYGPSYYGEEIYSVELKCEVLSKIEEDFKNFKSKSTLKEKVFFLLDLEYGNVPEFLIDMDVDVISVDPSIIVFPNTNHAKISKNKVYPLSNGGKIPLGICRKVKDGWSVVDGYNRLSRISDDVKKVKIISFS